MQPSVSVYWNAYTTEESLKEGVAQVALQLMDGLCHSTLADMDQVAAIGLVFELSLAEVPAEKADRIRREARSQAQDLRIPQRALQAPS